MAEKPGTAAGYRSEHVGLVRSTCLYIATKLGDMMDELVIVGGLVPSLVVDQQALPDGAQAHVGTMDLDVGLTIGLLDEGRYRTLTEALRAAGFAPDRNDRGNVTRQRWRVAGAEGVTVDFLIQPSRPTDRGGNVRHIEADFAAVIAPGLHLAFEDRERVTLSGHTIFGELAQRSAWVCGPGAYVVLKALAFESRGENKDAYDLYYLVRNFGTGVEAVATRLRPLCRDAAAGRALDVLRRDFQDHRSVGPVRVARFIAGAPDDEIQADVVGFVCELLRHLDE